MIYIFGILYIICTRHPQVAPSPPAHNPHMYLFVRLIFYICYVIHHPTITIHWADNYYILSCSDVPLPLSWKIIQKKNGKKIKNDQKVKTVDYFIHFLSGIYYYYFLLVFCLTFVLFYLISSLFIIFILISLYTYKQLKSINII